MIALVEMRDMVKSWLDWTCATGEEEERTFKKFFLRAEPIRHLSVVTHHPVVKSISSSPFYAHAHRKHFSEGPTKARRKKNCQQGRVAVVSLIKGDEADLTS